MNSNSDPTLEPITPPPANPATAEPASWSRMLLAALLVLLPGSLTANMALSLPARGVSAILCGLAVLLSGPYLLGHSLMRWARRHNTLAG